MGKVSDMVLGYFPGFFLGGLCGLIVGAVANWPKSSCGDTANQLTFIEEASRPGERFKLRSERVDGACWFVIETPERVSTLNEAEAEKRIKQFTGSASK